MKKLSLILGIIFILGSFTACASGKMQPKMNINKAELTKEEKNIADLISDGSGDAIFDFTVDRTIKSIQINTYKLSDGKWVTVSGGGGHAFDDNKGRIALNLENLANGMRTALQSKNTNGSVIHTISPTDEFADMSRTTAYMGNNTEIEYEKEIPLSIQISTTKNEINSYDVEYFNNPEKYQELGYEHVYAVTVVFSQKTLDELDSLSRNK